VLAAAALAGAPPLALDPAAFFAAAAAEGAALVTVAAAAADAGGGARLAGVLRAGASRRLSTVAENGAAKAGGGGWGSVGSEAEEESDGSGCSPEFTLRRTTARTAGRAARTAHAASPATKPQDGFKAPAQAEPQHHRLEPPAGASGEQQQVPTPAPAAAMPLAAPHVVLPGVLLPLKLELPLESAVPAQEVRSAPKRPPSSRPSTLLAGGRTVEASWPPALAVRCTIQALRCL
jgi:hypothetical protein